MKRMGLAGAMRGKRIAAKGIHRNPAMALRQGKRLALTQPDAPGADPLGRARVGHAVPDGAGSPERYCQQS